MYSTRQVLSAGIPASKNRFSHDLSMVKAVVNEFPVLNSMYTPRITTQYIRMGTKKYLFVQ